MTDTTVIYENALRDIEAAHSLIRDAQAQTDAGATLKNALAKLWRSTRAIQTLRDAILVEFPDQKRSRWQPTPPTPRREPLDDELPNWPPYNDSDEQS